jgi:tRNA (guanine26-N2/guanine27-N2)-dimethyltransferase
MSTVDIMTSIIEGSATMVFPSTEESTVFYNPVQVQNRDLSVLMITLAGERQAIRRAVAAEKKRLHKMQQGKVALKDGEPILHEKLEVFRSSLKGNELVDGLDSSKEGLAILDTLAASGLRSIRYWKEIPGVYHVKINDLDPAAIERARNNLKLNELSDKIVDDRSRAGISLRTGDGLQELYDSRRCVQTLKHNTDYKATPLTRAPNWDVIDLDPYGSAAPFMDAAVQGIASGGLLCVTCTDMTALGGAHPETCYGRYGSIPIQRAAYLQEVALRILLHSISTTAARYGRTIHPLLSVGMAFYVRVFVEVNDDKEGVKKLSLQTGQVYQSTHCPSFHIRTLGQLGGKKGTVYQAGRAPDLLKCEETGASFKIGGPLWLGQLHDQKVVAEALKRLESSADCSVPTMKWIATKDRLRGLLQSCNEELADVPLYYNLADLSKAVNASTIPAKEFKAALLNAGYRVSGYHKEPMAVKTDAPNSFVWDIMRAWCKRNPSCKQPSQDSTAGKILAIKPTNEIDFTIPRHLTKARSVARFPENPQPNWGPKPMASGHKRKAGALDNSVLGSV